jgi:hypothetical protein
VVTIALKLNQGRCLRYNERALAQYGIDAVSALALNAH